MKRKIPQSVAKRFRVTKNHKVIQKTAGQDHFNARESGNVTRKKRRRHEIYLTFAKTIRKLI